MANTTILDLPIATSLDGTEVVPIVQPPNGTTGVSKRVTVAQIAQLGIGVVPVSSGGTGDSTLPANEVLLGNGTAAVTGVPLDVAGYILTSNGTGSPPTFQGAAGLTNQPGLSVLGVTGNATGVPTAIIGTQSQVLRIADNGTALSFGTVNLSTSVAVTGVLQVVNGGLGAATLSPYTVLIGNNTATPVQVGPGGAGQLLIGQTVASNPQFATVGGDLTLSAAGTATISNGAVNFAKFQTVTPLSVLANSSSSVTNIVAVTGAAGQALVINSAGTGMAFSLLSFTANVTGVLPVIQGGSGTSTVAASSVVLGNGTSAFSAITNVTSGYILTSNGPNSAPTFQGAGGLSSQPGLSVLGVGGTSTATPSAVVGTTDQVLRIATNGTTLAFGAVNLSTSVAVTGTLPLANGGLGTTTLTVNSVLLGNGTSAISAVANVTSGYVLTANGTGSAPTFQGAGGLSNQPGLSVLGVTGNSTTTPTAITGTIDQVLRVASNGTALTFGALNLAGASAVTGVLPVGNGGSGTSALTAHGVLVGAGTSTVVITAPGSGGQLLIGQSVASDPQFATVGGDLTMTAAGTATISNNVVTYAKFQTVAALSVVANSSSATTNAAAIGGSANQTLVVNNGGTSLAFGQLNLSATAAVTGQLSLLSHVAGALPVSNGGVGTSTLTANAVLLGNGTAALSSVTNVTSGYVLTANGTSSAPTFQAAVSTGFTNLGTKNTTSGASVTLSGLSLTNYSFVYVVINGVKQNSGGSQSFSQNSVNLSGSIANNVQWSAMFTIELASGFAAGVTSAGSSPTQVWSSGITTASTAFTLVVSAGPYSGGSFTLYGL